MRYQLKQCSACRRSSHVQRQVWTSLTCYDHPAIEQSCLVSQREFIASRLQHKAAFCSGTCLPPMAPCLPQLHLACGFVALASKRQTQTNLHDFQDPKLPRSRRRDGFAGHAGSFASGHHNEKQFQQCEPDISRLSKELQQQWHPNKNAHHGNVIITPGSGHKVWWSCDQCPDGFPHVWESSVHNRTRGRGCPYCSGHLVCQHNTLARKAQHVAWYWDIAKMGSTSLDKVTANSCLRVHWKCPICLYEWQAKVADKVRGSTGCPKCARKHAGRKQDGTREKRPTFAGDQHPLLKQWHPEFNEKEGNFPANTTLQSNKHIWWVCDKCPEGKPHIWQTQAKSRTSGKKPTGCPYCAGRDVCECNSLQTVCPDIAADFDIKRNLVTPAQVTFSSGVKYSWLSDEPGAKKRSPNQRSSNTRRKARMASKFAASGVSTSDDCCQ